MNSSQSAVQKPPHGCSFLKSIVQPSAKTIHFSPAFFLHLIAFGFAAFFCVTDVLSVDSEGSERGSITGEVVVLGLETVGTHSEAWSPAAGI